RLPDWVSSSVLLVSYWMVGVRLFLHQGNGITRIDSPQTGNPLLLTGGLRWHSNRNSRVDVVWGDRRCFQLLVVWYSCLGVGMPLQHDEPYQAHLWGVRWIR